MYIQKAPNAAGSKISVTTTAANIFDLINTAAGTSLPNAGYTHRTNSIVIQPENGNVRVLFDGNTPTTTNGYLVSSGTNAIFANIPLKSMQLVSTSGTVTCSLIVGITSEGESTVISGTGSGGGGGGGETASAPAAASGDTLWKAKASGINADATSAYASATSLTVTGLSWTFNKNDIESITQIPTSGDQTIFSDKADFAVSGTTITVTGATFAASDTFIVVLDGPRKAPFDSTSGSNRVSEVAPVYTRQIPLLNVEVTNETNGTNNRRVDVSGLSKVFVQFNGVSGTDTITFTMEKSAQDDGTPIASVAYSDISQYGVDIDTAAVTAASYTADAAFTIDVKGVKSMNFKTVSAGGANDGDYNLYVEGAF